MVGSGVLDGRTVGSGGVAVNDSIEVLFGVTVVAVGVAVGGVEPLGVGVPPGCAWSGGAPDIVIDGSG